MFSLLCNKKVETTPTSPKELMLTLPIEKSSSAVEITVKSPSRDADLCALTSLPTVSVPEPVAELLKDSKVAVLKETSPVNVLASVQQTVEKCTNEEEQAQIKDSTSSTSSSSTTSNHTVMTTGSKTVEIVSEENVVVPPPRHEESLDKSALLMPISSIKSESNNADTALVSVSNVASDLTGSNITRNSYGTNSQKQHSSMSSSSSGVVVKSASNTSNSFKSSHRPSSGMQHAPTPPPPQRTFSIKDYTLYPPPPPSLSCGGRGPLNQESKQQSISGLAQSGSAVGMNKLNRWLSSVASSQSSSDRNSSLEDFSLANLSKSNQNIAGMSSYSNFSNNNISNNNISNNRSNNNNLKSN